MMKPFPDTPVGALRNFFSTQLDKVVFELNDFFLREGARASQEIDAARTPWLKRYNEKAQRIDKISYLSCYGKLLETPYRLGIIWKFQEQYQLLPFFQFGYVTSYYDPGLYCPYTVTMATTLAIEKYAPQALKERFLPKLLQKDQMPWQGATWMTEIKGGSDLGNNVETLAFPTQNGVWYLQGEKYFASNAHAELAVVAARPHNLKPHVKNLALFLVPRYTQKGKLNFFIERIKNKIGTRSVPTGEIRFDRSEAYLLGSQDTGIYLIMEVLNLSRVANAVGSTALIQRVLQLAYDFAAQRKAFGKFVIQFPLIRAQFNEHILTWERCFALTWKSVLLFNELWRLKVPYNEKYHAFRLLTHIAKYYTAEQAVRIARWAIEIWGGIGVLEEFPVERYLREALVLAIWEGTQHRHAIDALEVIYKKKAHLHLIQMLPEAYQKPLLEWTEKQIFSEDKNNNYKNAVRFLYQFAERFSDALLALPTFSFNGK